jgi:hypothetical protein
MANDLKEPGTIKTLFCSNEIFDNGVFPSERTKTIFC